MHRLFTAYRSRAEIRKILASARPFVVVLFYLIASESQAATYSVVGGNWDSVAAWNGTVTGDAWTSTQDNGETTPLALLGGNSGIVNWSSGISVFQTGTYSGALVTDEVGNVIGGSLIVSGNIGFSIVVPVDAQSWWYNEYTNLIIDFGSQVPSVSGHVCADTPLAPGPCAAGGAISATTLFAPVAGYEGIGGAFHSAATFDGSTLNIFHEGYSAAAPGSFSSIDFLTTFSLDATVLTTPIPAAALLFGSALLALGRFGSRRAT